MGRLRRRAESPDDDPSGLAGWLYTDLMLGLVVVFLGSVTYTSFKADTPVTPVTPVATTTTTTTVVGPAPDPCSLQTTKHRLTLRGNSDDPSLAGDFTSKVAREIAAAGLPLDNRIGFTVVFAGGTSEDNAKKSAQAFFARLTSVAPGLFGEQVFYAFYDNGLRPGDFNLDVHFLTGTCQ